MERERGWSGRMSEKMLNKQECFQPPVGDYTSTTAVSSYKTVRELERWKRVGVGVWERPRERVHWKGMSTFLSSISSYYRFKCS